MPEDRLWPVSIKGAVFVDEKVVLLLNDRAEWELPGGRLEKGETPIPKVYVKAITRAKTLELPGG